ncbi:MAG: hypothetical protein ACK5LS_03295 [Propioniciclava sp.]
MASEDSAEGARTPTADDLVRERRFAEAAAVYEQQAGFHDEAGLLDQAGLAWLEAARCWQQDGRRDTAHAAYARGTALLVAGGAEALLVASVLTAWAPVAFASGASDTLLSRLDGLLSRVADGDAATKAELLDTRARVLASFPAADRAPGRDLVSVGDCGIQAAEAYASVGRTADAAESFWLAGRALRDAGETGRAVQAIESASARW